MEMCTEQATSWITDLYWFYDKERKKEELRKVSVWILLSCFC